MLPNVDEFTLCIMTKMQEQIAAITTNEGFIFTEDLNMSQ